MRRALLSVAVAGLAAAAWIGAPPRAAVAVETHRAAVVVDLGDQVKTARITFSSDSISGIDALELAGFDPEVRGYGSVGAAVCALCGRGCPADGSCLTCGGRDYWSYWRSEAGASSWTYSAGGAGVTRVHDGDVEGWAWSAGEPPSYVSFGEVWGEAPPATAPPSSAPPATSPPADGGAADDRGGGAVTTSPGRDVTASGETSAAPGTSTPSEPGVASGADGAPRAAASEDEGRGTPGSSAARRDGDDGGPSTSGDRAAADGERGAPRVAAASADAVADRAVAPEVGSDGSGSWVGAVAFVVVALGLVGWIGLHRRRSRAAAQASGRSTEVR